MLPLKEAVAQRFTEVLSTLKIEKKVKEGSIAVNNGYVVSNMTQIKNGTMNPPDKIIEYLQKKYNVNPDYIFLGKGPMFGKSEAEIEVSDPPAQYENKKGSDSEPLERIYLVESVKNLTETEKMNARSIERLLNILETQNSYLYANLAPSNKSSQTQSDPGVTRGSEKAVRATSGSKRKTG
jgi:hypothetical protein